MGGAITRSEGERWRRWGGPYGLLCIRVELPHQTKPRSQGTFCDGSESLLHCFELNESWIIAAADGFVLVSRRCHTGGMAWAFWRHACFGGAFSEDAPHKLCWPGSFKVPRLTDFRILIWAESLQFYRKHGPKDRFNMAHVESKSKIPGCRLALPCLRQSAIFA